MLRQSQLRGHNDHTVAVVEIDHAVAPQRACAGAARLQERRRQQQPEAQATSAEPHEDGIKPPGEGPRDPAHSPSAYECCISAIQEASLGFRIDVGKFTTPHCHRELKELAAVPLVAQSGRLGVVRPLRYSINVTLDGCCDHRAGSPDEETHRHATKTLDEADALLFGRVTYEMMESAWRPPGQMEAMPDWMAPFGRTIDAAKKYVVSSTLEQVDWNAELVRGDLGEAIRELKRESGKGLLVGGVKLPLALAELGLIDEYEFVVQPRLVGHGPKLFAGLSKRVDLRLVGRLEFGSGAVGMGFA